MAAMSASTVRHHANPDKAGWGPMDTGTFCQVLDTLDATYGSHPMGENFAGKPFEVLIACLLSLRARDDVTIPISRKLLDEAPTPEALAEMPYEDLIQKIRKIGFYRTKATTLQSVSRKLVDEFNSQVPDTVEALVEFPGVGRKTANLVVGMGFDKPAICVDVHVHRICYRLGYLEAKTPEETEMALRAQVPQHHWRQLNKLLVQHGQLTCKPVAPHCDRCAVYDMCRQIAVKPRKLPIKKEVPV